MYSFNSPGIFPCGGRRLWKSIFGRTINPVARQWLVQSAWARRRPDSRLNFGFLGLSIEQVGILFILPVAVLLLLVNPRFLCFAYAGGLVGLVSILMRAVVRFYPGLQSNVVIESLVNIHIPALLILIGLLHLVEALLISISGHWGCSPLYYRVRMARWSADLASSGFGPYRW